jgi:hypothetical protein
MASIPAFPSCAPIVLPPAPQPLQYFRSPAQLLVHDRPTADGLVRASVNSLSSDDTWQDGTSTSSTSSSSSNTKAHHKRPGLEQNGAVAAPAASGAASGAANGAGIARANGSSAPAAAAGRAKAGSK